MSLVERKKLELDAKSQALAGELAHWRAVSAANQPYEKHHSQIARISARLESVIGGITKEIAALNDGTDAVLIAGQRIEERLLAAHLVWDFFRSRLAMRGDAFLRTYLDACDEFAWSCYEGARKRFFEAREQEQQHAANVAQAGGASATAVAGGAGAAEAAGTAGALASANVAVGKEPPLVFLNGGWSPFAVSREQALDLDRPAFNVAGGTVAWLQTGEFHSVVRDLPFPMIGVPWYQLRHLPDALVLGHEMGHVLEWDFTLKPDMEAALAALPLIPIDRQKAWSAWRMEIFADIVGALAGGPRFGGALMDFLATMPVKVQQERRTVGVWGAYPMRWLRIDLVAYALRNIGFAKEAATLRADWQQTYGAPAIQAEFAGDVPAVVTALIDGPYAVLGDAKLTDLISFRTDAAGAPYDEAVVDAIFGQGSLDIANPREFFAAARLIYERDPAGFAKQDYNTRICELVIEHRMPGTRGTPFDTLEALEATEAALADDWLFGRKAP
jgi:hypothetical protein